MKKITMALCALSTILIPEISQAFQETMPPQQIELGVMKSVDFPDNRCPERIVVTEQTSVYEGGYSINGKADLSQYAGPFTIAAADQFGVIWTARLKPAYQQCVAAGGMVKVAGEPYSSHSYLRVKFDKGRLNLYVDMVGVGDVNSYASVVIDKGVVRGNPTWSWSGSD